MRSKFFKFFVNLAIGALFMLFPAMQSFADSTEPLNFTAVGGSATVKLTKVGTPDSISLQYSTDNRTTWNTYSIDQVISLNSGSKVYFKATSNNSYFSKSDKNYYNFVMTDSISADGNIMSLLDATMQQTSVPSYAFISLFQNCSSLIAAPALPATTLDIYCYRFMFYGCTSLTNAPALPATSLVFCCYEYMFADCTSLVGTPALPATTLDSYCYLGMFFRCTSLTSAPALPATTLDWYCYSNMFNGCTSLTSAPALPATTLQYYCYSLMFANCTSLTSAPDLPATTLAEYCYENMFDGCTSLTVPPALPVRNLTWRSCYSSMFARCTSLITAPTLPATTLSSSCYSWMFDGCTSLTDAPTLSVRTLADYCYAGMFRNCTSLANAPALPATSLAKSCYFHMFDGCVSLAKTPVLSATDLDEWCYSGMFEGCNSLSALPALPATSLSNYCYREMFANCTSLIVNKNGSGTTWSIPATSTADNALDDMFTGTSGTMNGTPAVKTNYYIASDPNVRFTVSAKPNNSSRGTVTGGGQYKRNETATLTATPKTGCFFTCWSNGETSETINITVTGDVTLTAYFETNASTAVDDVDDADAVVVAPNPIHVGEVTYLHLNEMEYSGAIIEILNAAGNCVRRIEASSTAVEIDGINTAGTYLVRITSGTGKVYIRKLIVQ